MKKVRLDAEKFFELYARDKVKRYKYFQSKLVIGVRLTLIVGIKLGLVDRIKLELVS